MYAVIFEVQPKTELAAQAQQKGRGEIFKDYHIIVAKVIRDYEITNRKEAP